MQLAVDGDVAWLHFVYRARPANANPSGRLDLLRSRALNPSKPERRTCRTRLRNKAPIEARPHEMPPLEVMAQKDSHPGLPVASQFTGCVLGTL